MSLNFVNLCAFLCALRNNSKDLIMNKVYRSKIGPELVILLVMALAPGFYATIVQPDYYGLGIISVVTLLIIHLFATTKYTVQDTLLRVQSSFLVNKKVDIKTITKIKDTYNPISSPAASIDRMEVSFDRGDSVVISPKDKKGFVSHLQSINPDIVYMPRNKKVK